MPTTSTTPSACFVIESNTVTTDQQIEADLLTETHPPTPSNMITGIDRVEGMLSDTIKVCEHVKRSRVTSSPSSMPLGLRSTARVSSLYIKHKIQIESGPKIVEAAGVILTKSALSMRSPNTRCSSAVSSRSFVDLLLRPTAAS
jgi:hypothetical protein